MRILYLTDIPDLGRMAHQIGISRVRKSWRLHECESFT